MIELNNIQVTFNPGTILENRALKGVSLEVPEHQFLTVIGSNGAGKSTLLGAVTGETPMIGGQVVIDGKDVTKQTVAQRATQCARVFQDPLAGTCGELTIEENMALAYMRGKKTWLGAGAVCQASQVIPRTHQYFGFRFGRPIG